MLSGHLISRRSNIWSTCFVRLKEIFEISKCQREIHFQQVFLECSFCRERVHTTGVGRSWEGIGCFWPKLVWHVDSVKGDHALRHHYTTETIRGRGKWRTNIQIMEQGDRRRTHRFSDPLKQATAKWRHAQWNNIILPLWECMGGRGNGVPLFERNALNANKRV